jgi:dTMP kinase
LTAGVRGAFIVIEGPEGAGKTTLAGALARRLRAAGMAVQEVREPGGTPLAEAARRAALDPALAASPVAELFLMLAARADHVSNVIEQALAQGKIVLCDRFELSTEAYQIAGRQLPRAAVLEANRVATGGLTPDLTLVVDVPVDVGLARQAASGKTADRIEGDGRELHERVAEAFRTAAGPSVVHLDGTRGPEDVERAAWDVVRARLGEQFSRLRVEPA